MWTSDSSKIIKSAVKHWLMWYLSKMSNFVVAQNQFCPQALRSVVLDSLMTQKRLKVYVFRTLSDTYKREKKKAESLWQRLKLPAVRHSEESSVGELLPTCRFRDRIQSYIRNHSWNPGTPPLVSALILEFPKHHVQPSHISGGLWRTASFLNGSQQCLHQLGHGREKKTKQKTPKQPLQDIWFLGLLEDIQRRTQRRWLFSSEIRPKTKEDTLLTQHLCSLGSLPIERKTSVAPRTASMLYTFYNKQINNLKN